MNPPSFRATVAAREPALAAKGFSEAQAVAVVVRIGPAQVLGRLLFLAFGRWPSARSIGLIVLDALPVSLAIFALANQMAALLSRAAAPLATAWLLLALPGYREMLLVLSALGVLALGAFALARPPSRRGP